MWVVGEEHVAGQEGGSPFVDLEAYSVLHAAEMDGDVGGVGDEAAWRMVGGVNFGVELLLLFML